jgi:hypothetical protein
MVRGRVRGGVSDLPLLTPLSGRSGMSRLVMLSDATGVRAYAGVMPTRIPAQQHQSGYGACKDARERANTVQTRHLDALWRITATSRLVAKEYELRRQRLGADGTSSVFPSWRTRCRGWSWPAARNDPHDPGTRRAARTSPGRLPGGAEGRGEPRSQRRACMPTARSAWTVPFP